MKAPDRVVLLTVASPLFPEAAARDLMGRSAGTSPAVTPISVLAHDKASAASALSELKPDRIAGLVVQLSTFATAEILHDVLAALGDRKIPIALWALEERGEIITNSLCGVQLWASTLVRFGHRPTVLIGDPEGAVGNDLDAFAAAARAQAALSSAQIALVGSHADWFTNLAVEPATLHRIVGATVRQVSLQAFIQSCKATPESEVAASTRWDDTIFDGGDNAVGKATMGQTFARLDAGLSAIKADAIAIRDWPEILYADGFRGTWAALGELSDRAAPIAPEGDVMGAATAVAVRAMLPESLPFLTDISGLDRDNDRLVLWHYGVSPRLSNGPRHVDAAMKQESFPLKSGPMTLIRLSLRPGGELRIFVAEGTLLAEPTGANRAAGYFQPSNGGAEALVRGFIAAGYEHHVTAVYGRLAHAAAHLAHAMGAKLDGPGAWNG